MHVEPWLTGQTPFKGCHVPYHGVRGGVFSGAPAASAFCWHGQVQQLLQERFRVLLRCPLASTSAHRVKRRSLQVARLHLTRYQPLESDRGPSRAHECYIYDVSPTYAHLRACRSARANTYPGPPPARVRPSYESVMYRSDCSLVPGTKPLAPPRPQGVSTRPYRTAPTLTGPAY